MSPVAACGLARCPVPEPNAEVLRRLRTEVIPAGAKLRRGHKKAYPDSTSLVRGVGDTRFAPLAGVEHVYLATTTFAALLESAFHDAAPPDPRIPEAVIALWAEAEVELRYPVRLIDLRDGELARLGIDRDQLVATDATQYPCTRRWAEVLHGRHVGGQETHGLLWHSRQVELHAAAMAGRPALRDLLDEHPAEVGVLWAPPTPGNVLEVAPEGLGDLDTGAGLEYVNDAIALLGIVTL